MSGLYADNDATFTLTVKRNVREGGREIEEAIKGSRLMITEITRRIKRKRAKKESRELRYAKRRQFKNIKKIWQRGR